MANQEKHAANNRNWKRNNPSRNSFNQTAREALKKNAAPPWLSAIQLAQIQEFYDVAVAVSTQTGVAHQVDHIHPLKGATFNGLHVPWNLQVITASENASKKNRIPRGSEALFWGVE